MVETEFNQSVNDNKHPVNMNHKKHAMNKTAFIQRAERKRRKSLGKIQPSMAVQVMPKTNTTPNMMLLTDSVRRDPFITKSKSEPSSSTKIHVDLILI